jgi:hypothetical protein
LGLGQNLTEFTKIHIPESFKKNLKNKHMGILEILARFNEKF